MSTRLCMSCDEEIDLVDYPEADDMGCPYCGSHDLDFPVETKAEATWSKRQFKIALDRMLENSK